MHIREVGKHLMGVGHIFVDVVEVVEQHLSPAIEMV